MKYSTLTLEGEYTRIVIKYDNDTTEWHGVIVLKQAAKEVLSEQERDDILALEFASKDVGKVVDLTEAHVKQLEQRIASLVGALKLNEDYITSLIRKTPWRAN